MNKAIAAAALLAAAVGIAGGSDAAVRTPSVRLVSMQPLAVRGQMFVPRELVRVKVDASTTETRRVRASGTGTFTAGFEEILVTRCDSVRVVATGSRGSRAVLKFLPAPACLPA